jgi:hypothetical protein
MHRTKRVTADDATFCKKVLNVTQAHCKPKVVPDCKANHVRWNAMALESAGKLEFGDRRR